MNARTAAGRKAYRLALIACSASKLPHAAPARELYTGALFKASLAVAELLADRVLILSAKHHVLELDTVVEPYDVSLSDLEKPARLVWGDIVARQLLRELGIKNRTDIAECEEAGEGVLCLAPGSYAHAIGFLYGTTRWAMPLRGLGIGKQKQRLAQMAAAMSVALEGEA